MTRKDYQLIANAFAEYPLTEESRLIIESLSDRLKNDNPRFDRERFIAACEGK